MAEWEQWEQRNRHLAELREELRQNPLNLDLANRYWHSLAGDRAKSEADYRSGRNVIEAYREAALLSKDGVAAFARAYQDLLHISGESPRLAFFDESLLLSLKTRLPELAVTDRKNVEWILHSVGQLGAERQ